MAIERDYIVSTGDHIDGWLLENNMTQAELARRLGVSQKHVSELVSGKAPLSHSVACNLEIVTGTPAEIWMRIESSYRQSLARQEKRAQFNNEGHLAESFPLSYMRKNGLISATKREPGRLVEQLCHVFRVSSLVNFEKNWGAGQVAFRKSPSAQERTYALATWLRIGEYQFESAKALPPFEPKKLENTLPALRALTVQEPETAFDTARQLLAECGVRLCYTPPISGLKIHGCTRWFNGDPLIQLSLYLKNDDQMWFTLFHEIGHVLIHGEGTYLNEVSNRTENEANNFALEQLFPASFRSQLPDGRDNEVIKELANEWGIAPGIVLGQAQRLSGDYTWGHELRRKVKLPSMIPGIAA